MPQIARRLAMESVQTLPAVAAVTAQEQARRLDAGVQGVRLATGAGRQAPDRFQAGRVVIQAVARHLGQRLPTAPGVRTAIDVNAPDRVMRGGIAGPAVTRVDECALDFVTGQMRPFDMPVSARPI